jgi:hypothetical protein
MIWDVDWQDSYPACYVVNTQGDRFVDGFQTYLEASAFIHDIEDKAEKEGEIPPSLYVLPCKATPAGRDVR